MTYDPKFTQKQMYDQYGSSRETTKKADPKPSRSSGFSGMGSDPAEQFGGSPTRGIGAKPPSNTFGGGQDNNPNRDEYENKPTIAKVYEKTVDLFKSFGAKEPEALIVDGKRVYQGPLFSGYDPTVRIGPFGGDAGKKQYRLGMPILGEVSPSYPSPTLPPADNNPTLNMFGVRRGFTRGTDMPDLSVSPEAPANMDPMTRVLSQAMLPTEVNYTIQDGDTLSEIARDADTTVEELKELNNIENIDEIDAGANLKVPVKAGKLTDTQAALRRGLDRPKDNQGVETAMDLSKLSVTELMNLLKEATDKIRGKDTTKSTVGLGSKPDTGGYDEIPDFVPKTKDDIKTTQEILNEAGYYSGKLAKIDGKKGPNYRNAIKSLQHNNGLEVTGEINTETARVIRREDFVKNSRPTDPLLSFISSGEGGYGAANNGNSNRLKKKGKLFSIYDSYYSENQSKPLQSMTIKEILRAQIGKPNASMDEIKKHFEDQTNDKGKYIYTGAEMDNREFFAVGAYQIIPPTMMAAVNSMSLSGEEVYTPQLQDKIARDFLAADKRPTLNAYLKGSDKVTVEDAMDDAAKEWASLPTRTGLGHYKGQRSKHTAAEAKKILEESQAEYIIDNIGIAR